MHLTEEQQAYAIKALATTLGKTAEEIETIVAGEQPTAVDKLVSDRLKVIRSEGDKAGRGILQKELNKKAAEAFGLETDSIATVGDLVEAVKANYQPEVDPAKLDEATVKSHPSFKAIEKALKEKDKEYEGKLAEAKAEGENRFAALQLDMDAESALAKFNAVLSDDPKIAKAQKHLYKEELKGVVKKVDESGSVEFWKEGKRIETDKLQPVSEEEFWKSVVTSNFSTQVSKQIDSPNTQKNGQPNQQGTPTFTHFKGVAPKTQEEAEKIFMDYTQSPAAVKEVNDWWKQQQQAA